MRRVDVVDPGADGTRIGNALRDEGLSVDQRTLESLVAEGTDATLLVLAGDAAGAVDAVRSVRAAPRSTAIPIVLVGSPVEGPLKERDLVRLGADAYLPRPVNVPLLIEKVRTLLAAAPAAPMREPTVRLPSDSAA